MLYIGKQKKNGFYLLKGLVTFCYELRFALSLVCHMHIFVGVWIVRATVQAHACMAAPCMFDTVTKTRHGRYRISQERC